MANLFSFYGRARRTEYWVTTIIISIATSIAAIATVIFAVVTFALGTINFLENLTGEQSVFRIAPAFKTILLLWIVFIVLTTWLFLAVTARRLRDAGWKTWLTFIVILPIFSLIGVSIQTLTTFLVGEIPSEATIEIWGLIWFSLLYFFSLISSIAWIVFGCIGSKESKVSKK